MRALRRALARPDGFSLILAVCDNLELRDDLIELLNTTLPEPAPDTVRLSSTSWDVLAHVKRENGIVDRGPLFVVGLERIFDSGQRDAFLGNLNLARSDWPEYAARPVVFWVPTWILGDLLRGAPDFFDWRSDTIFFPSDRRVMRDLQHWITPDRTYAGDGHLDVEERRRRVDELKSRLNLYEGSDDPSTLRVVGSWLDELGDHLYFMGKVDEALRIRQEEELPLYERLGDMRSRAITLRKVADILSARGDPDEALRTLREDVLPAFERLGDVRARAITLGKVADILQARGDLDEALRIRQEEELPVYELLGDVRSRAVTLGNMAEIFSARRDLDNLDEALRTLREDVLPVFERLGDVRSLLVGRANLAVNHLRRNEAYDRAEAVRLLRLSLAAAKQLRLPVEIGKIESILRRIGEQT